jgi:hypothetical protein
LGFRNPVGFSGSDIDCWPGHTTESDDPWGFPSIQPEFLTRADRLDAWNRPNANRINAGLGYDRHAIDQPQIGICRALPLTRRSTPRTMVQQTDSGRGSSTRGWPASKLRQMRQGSTAPIRTPAHQACTGRAADREEIETGRQCGCPGNHHVRQGGSGSRDPRRHPDLRRSHLRAIERSQTGHGIREDGGQREGDSESRILATVWTYFTSPRHL